MRTDAATPNSNLGFPRSVPSRPISPSHAYIFVVSLLKMVLKHKLVIVGDGGVGTSSNKRFQRFLLISHTHPLLHSPITAVNQPTPHSDSYRPTNHLHSLIQTHTTLFSKTARLLTFFNPILTRQRTLYASHFQENHA